MNLSDATLSLLGTVLSLVLAIGGAILIPLLKKWLAAKVGNEKSNMLLDWAYTAVRAAEQLLGPQAGDAKYAFVLKALNGVVESQHINVDATTLQAAIEAAVHELNASQITTPAAAAVGNVVVAAPEAAIVATNGNGNGNSNGG